MSYPHNQPGQAYWYPAQTVPPRVDSAAGVLAGVAALGFGVLTALGSAAQYHLWWSYSDEMRKLMGVLPSMVCGPIAALLLIPGGVLLLRRTAVGRVLVILGFVPLFTEQVLEWQRHVPASPFVLAWSLGFMALYLGVAILAALPSVTRWINAREMNR
ncbi:hypothetical protein ABZ412_02270 [Nocardia sp. NPDC005746]|uniref:hypothetical protein n=1 Tax=Nocardia sp. NPDC005746 TaxID=3157062 RepID=UPI0033EEA76D